MCSTVPCQASLNVFWDCRRDAVKSIIVLAWIFITLAVLCSIGAFIAKGTAFLKLARHRRSQGLGVQETPTYYSLLCGKIVRMENDVRNVPYRPT